MIGEQILRKFLKISIFGHLLSVPYFLYVKRYVEVWTVHLFDIGVGGTQNRGFTSMNGAVATTSIDTCRVVDVDLAALAQLIWSANFFRGS